MARPKCLTCGRFLNDAEIEDGREGTDCERCDPATISDLVDALDEAYIRSQTQ